MVPAGSSVRIPNQNFQREGPLRSFSFFLSFLLCALCTPDHGVTPTYYGPWVMTIDDVGLQAGAIACEAAARPPHAILAGYRQRSYPPRLLACRYIHTTHTRTQEGRTTLPAPTHKVRLASICVWGVTARGHVSLCELGKASRFDALHSLSSPTQVTTPMAPTDLQSVAAADLQLLPCRSSLIRCSGAGKAIGRPGPKWSKSLYPQGRRN